MAFYSVRVDEDGKEIVPTRRTFRKLILDSIDNEKTKGKPNNNIFKINNNENKNNNVNLYQSNKSPVVKSTYKTVRYVNSATFIEKDSNQIKKLQQEDNPQEHRSNDGKNDVIDHQYQSHIVMESVPSLELNSNESFPSSGENLTYSYRRVCEVTKIIKKPDAYNEWLAAKRLAKSYEIKQKLEKQKYEEEKKLKRKLLSEEKFNKWLDNKKYNKKQLKDLSNDVVRDENKNNTNEIKNDDAQRKHQLWLKQKIQKVKEQKENLNQNERLKQESEEKRREQAEIVYKKWLKTAPYKPKPVPLNQGLLTLKGSISYIFINPKPWVSNSDY